MMAATDAPSIGRRVADVAVWLVGGGRVATGLGFLAAPEHPARVWTGGDTDPARYLVRAVGGRDAVIGAGVLWARATGQPVWPWLAASVGADLADATASPMLDPHRAGRTRWFALGFASLGAFALLARNRS